MEEGESGFLFYKPLVFYLGILFDVWVQVILPVIFCFM